MLVLLRGITGVGLHIDVGDWSIEECDHSQVGSTGGESLAATLCRLDLENRLANTNIRGKNEGNWDNNHEHTDNLVHYLNEMGIHASQASYRGAFTKVVVDYVWSTVWQPHGGKSMYQSKEEATGPSPSSQACTQVPAEDDSIMQWVTDGYVSVISHDYKQNALSQAQGTKHKHL